MLLSKIPVLDKGYVALISSCNTTAILREIDQEFFFGSYPTVLEDLGSMTLAIKCPLFIQLNLSKYNLKIITTEQSNGQLEAYIPNAAQVGGSDVTTSQLISDDIARTTDAVLINSTAYQTDGCVPFVSQVLTPINVYTTLIVQGTYKEWCAYAFLVKNQPGPLLSYKMTVQQIITSEWK